MKLKNYQEDLVLYVADIVMKDRPDVKASGDLLHDVAAYTLNRLPPRYIMSERGFTRLAADHWFDAESDDGLAGLVEVLILVNRAIDIVKSRRKPERQPEAAAGEQDEIPDVRKYWHNLPYLIGRILDQSTGKPVLNASVHIYINNHVAEPAEKGWLNPYRTNAATRGFFSFLPRPVRSRSKLKRFSLKLSIEHAEFQPLVLEKTIETPGELTTPQFIRSDQILNLDNAYLRPKES